MWYMISIPIISVWRRRCLMRGLRMYLRYRRVGFRSERRRSIVILVVIVKGVGSHRSQSHLTQLT